jgi:hypothetical protein
VEVAVDDAAPDDEEVGGVEEVELLDFLRRKGAVVDAVHTLAPVITVLLLR